MKLALVATLVAFGATGLLALRWRRVAWLAGALLATCAVLLLLSGLVKAGAVTVVATGVWLCVAIDRRPGGAR